MKNRVRQMTARCGIFAMMLVAGAACASDMSPTKASSAECIMSPRQVVEAFAELLYEKKQVRLAFET